MRGMDGYMRGVNLGGWLSQFVSLRRTSAVSQDWDWIMSVCPWITP